MASVTPSGITGLIVTRDIEMPDPSPFTALAAAHAATAARFEAAAEQLRTDNRTREKAARSPAFKVGHLKMAEAEVAAVGGADYYARLSAAASSVAVTVSEVAAGHTALVGLAEAELQQPDADRAAIIRRYRDDARRVTEAGVSAMSGAIRWAVNGLGAPNISALTAMLTAGGVPAAPPPSPLDSLDNSTTSAGHRGEYSRSDPGVARGGRSDPGARGDYEDGGLPSTDSSDDPGVGVGNTAPGHRGDYTPATTPGATSPRASASPLGGGVPSLGGMGSGGGGLGSGGGMPKMPGGLGGGGMPGLGSNPLGSGMGQVPGAGSGLPSASGLGGSGTGAGAPAAAFSLGQSTGSAIGGGMPAAPPPAPPSPSSAMTGGGPAVSAGPLSAASAGGMAPVAGQSGMVAPAGPAAAPAGAGVGGGAGAPMMLPPGSMGPQAGAAPPPAAPTVPAGSVGAASSASSAPSGAGAGATLIPASVVAAGQTAAARERRESADAAAAKELAWRLQHAAQTVGYPAEWAVGVFRSPSGTETVITSNDGSSYIPAGVFVPRSVRVLAADPLLDDHFRQLWFGWDDPARVLIEYAKLRAELGWRLVAAATTTGVSALRDAGVEHPPSCSRDVNPLLRKDVQVDAPVLDEMHAHRLAVVWPEVYPRLLRVMDADPICQDRIVRGVTAALIAEVATLAHAIDGGIHDALRQIWAARGGDREPSLQQWAEYDKEAKALSVFTALRRPAFGTGAVADPSETVEALAVYRAHWVVARTAEHISGWSTRPLPLPDMCYAAAATGNPRLRDMIVNALVSVEEDLLGAE